MNQPGSMPSPSQSAKHFLHLLDDINHIHEMFQEEILALRHRVRELEVANSALAGAQLPDIRGCAVYLVNPQGGILAWSDGAREVYGYSVEEVLGKSPRMLHPRDETDPKHSEAGVVARIRKDGIGFEVYARSTSLFDEVASTGNRIVVEIPIHARQIATEEEP